MNEILGGSWGAGSCARALVAGIACLVAGLACSDGLEPIEALDVAVIGYYIDDAPRITVPDTVTAGEPFAVTVESFGNSCVRLGETEVGIVSGGAVVTPLDFVTRGGICEDILLTFEHEASVTLVEAGSSTVVVRGRAVPGGPIMNFPYTVWVK